MNQMEIREIEQHKFNKLIEYALKHKSFSVEQACEALVCLRENSIVPNIVFSN
jgi:hypothetical protein